MRPGRVSRNAPDGDFVAEALACRRGGRLIFAGLSFTLPQGGALLLTGANGSGKSSLLRLLATLLAPEAGRLLWGGVPVSDNLPGYRALLGYVGHLDAIKPALSVRETLGFWAGLRGAAQTLDEPLAAFGLDTIADWPCRWLSAGQRRRLALARLLAAPVPFWLLDEPTAALDTDGEAHLAAAIAAHRAAGGRAVIATHQAMALPEAGELRLGDFTAAEDLLVAL
jgi:heme exporter protein A